MTKDEINKVLEGWEHAYIHVDLGPAYGKPSFLMFAGLFVWATDDGIAWETPEALSDIPLHSGHMQRGTWRRAGDNEFVVDVTGPGPDMNQTIHVYNWAGMQEGDLYEDLMAAHKGRTKQDLARERRKREPGKALAP